MNENRFKQTTLFIYDNIIWILERILIFLILMTVANNNLIKVSTLIKSYFEKSTTSIRRHCEMSGKLYHGDVSSQYFFLSLLVHLCSQMASTWTLSTQWWSNVYLQLWTCMLFGDSLCSGLSTLQSAPRACQALRRC